MLLAMKFCGLFVVVLDVLIISHQGVFKISLDLYHTIHLTAFLDSLKVENPINSGLHSSNISHMIVLNGFGRLEVYVRVPRSPRNSIIHFKTVLLKTWNNAKTDVKLKLNLYYLFTVFLDYTLYLSFNF